MSRAEYRSERRRQQAAATRRAIIDAARALFVERGYANTTVADIAAAANVAIPTVYASVGPKAAILAEWRKQIPVLAGVPDDTQSALADVSDPADAIRGCVAVIRRMMETSGDLLCAIESAAPFEPVAAQAWEEGLVIHRRVWGLVVERLEELGALSQAPPNKKIADVLSLLSLPATWRTLGRDYAWTYEEIEAWIVETAFSLIAGQGLLDTRRHSRSATRPSS